MIIGIDASRANRDHKTGVEWYAYYIIKNLVEMDHDNDYILYSDKPLKDDLARLCREHSNCKEMVLHWPFRRFWTLGRLSWEMVMRPPDVLFNFIAIMSGFIFDGLLGLHCRELNRLLRYLILLNKRYSAIF